MRRLLTIAALVLVAATALAQIRGIPASVTSLGPKGWHTGPFVSAFPHGHSGGFTFKGNLSFGHNPRFNVFFGGGRRHSFRSGFAHGFGQQPVIWPTAWGGGYAAPIVIYTGAPSEAYYDENGTSPRVRRETLDRETLRRMIEEELAYREELDRAKDEPPAKAPGKGEPKVEERPSPATVLVFRDGRRFEVVNYAIVGPTVYEFAPQRRKLVLAELDVDATVKANEDRGVTFKLPARPKP